MKTGEKIWVVKDEFVVRLYSCEKYAKEAYQKILAYYKHHKPDENDIYEYNVWMVVDEDESHYALITSTIDGDENKHFNIYYACKEIVK